MCDDGKAFALVDPPSCEEAGGILDGFKGGLGEAWAEFWNCLN
ncbi:MAG: hypothetical protein ACI8T1_000783 [Verrucomicrobiales bacterium]|jgi:hypothetical protein